MKRLVNAIHTVDGGGGAVGRGFLSCVVLAGLDERLEDRGRVLEVVVNDVDEEGCVHQILD